MTIRRMASGMVDDDNVCVALDCGVPAPARPWQTTLPIERDGLLARAEQLEAQAKLLRQEARGLDVEIEAQSSEPPPPWLCPGHRQHLHDPVLRQVFGAGFYTGREPEQAVEAVQAYVDSHRPGSRGSCRACMPGSKAS